MFCCSDQAQCFIHSSVVKIVSRIKQRRCSVSLLMRKPRRSSGPVRHNPHNHLPTMESPRRRARFTDEGALRKGDMLRIDDLGIFRDSFTSFALRQRGALNGYLCILRSNRLGRCSRTPILTDWPYVQTLSTFDTAHCNGPQGFFLVNP